MLKRGDLKISLCIIVKGEKVVGIEDEKRNLICRQKCKIDNQINLRKFLQELDLCLFKVFKMSLPRWPNRLCNKLGESCKSRRR